MQATDTSVSSTRTLDIGGMSGEECVKNVKTALKSVPEVTTQSVKVGSAVIQADQTGCDAACACVTSAGYKATEDTSMHSAGAKAAKPMGDNHPDKKLSQQEMPSGMPEKQANYRSASPSASSTGAHVPSAVVVPSGKAVSPSM
jgi:copper chaperone CopZ